MPPFTSFFPSIAFKCFVPSEKKINAKGKQGKEKEREKKKNTRKKSNKCYYLGLCVTEEL